MGQKIILTDTTFTDTSLPKLFDDPGMSAGTLMLVDPGRTSGAFSDLANGALVPNIAAQVAGPIVEASGDALKGVIEFVTAASDQQKVERTPKLGIHVLESQVNQTVTTNRWGILMPLALADYIYDNPTRGYYASVWFRPTRTNIASAAPTSLISMIIGNPASGNYLWHLQGASPSPISGSALLGRVPGSYSTLASQLAAVGVAGPTGAATVPPTSPNGRFLVVGNGNLGGFGGQNANPSVVLYRAIIEDLSLTKRANGGAGGTLAEEYAAALASDQAQYALAFGTGGRFNGDTIPTDPTTYP